MGNNTKIIEKITRRVKKLSDAEREKLLKIIELIDEDNEWFNFSLSSAMKGLEDDTMPEYSVEDLKEKWQ
jgi:hypothetical protein